MYSVQALYSIQFTMYNALYSVSSVVQCVYGYRGVLNHFIGYVLHARDICNVNNELFALYSVYCTVYSV